MKSTRFRLLAVLACFALVIAACGDSGDDEATGDGDGTEAPAADGAFILPSEDCAADYDGTKGIEGDTIKIGTVRPASGPYSIYDTVTKGIEKFFESANAKGGLEAGDGKKYKVTLLKEDDGYDPSRTPALVEKLVEQDGVFAIVGEIGTETNLAVRQYLNDACVPSIALATGSTQWGEAATYPWYIAGLPSYATEARAFLEYLETVKPDAKIAVLKQNDDFGGAYSAAIAKYIEDTDSAMEVVGEETYDASSGGTTEGATVKLADTNADVLFVGIGGTQCSKTLTFLPADWQPMTYVSITCSGKLSLSLAGGKDEGIFTTQATLDPGSAADAADPRIQQFFTDGAAQGLTQQEMEGGIVSAGWGFASVFAQALSLTEDVSRAGIMNAAFAMSDQNFGLQRAEQNATTDGAEDPWILESLRVVQRKGGDWTEVSPMKDYNGQSSSFAG